MVWAGISLEARTELYIIPRGSLTAVRYINEILQNFVVPYVDFIGINFILMHDNVRTHTTRITQQYLNDVDIDVLELNMSGTCLGEEYEVMFLFL
nr:unnamed protein product [Callosobruchus chinensis]